MGKWCSNVLVALYPNKTTINDNIDVSVVGFMKHLVCCVRVSEWSL